MRGCLPVSQIRVSPEQLAAVSGQLQSGSDQIEATLQQLASQVMPLGQEWTGVAQQRFF